MLYLSEQEKTWLEKQAEKELVPQAQIVRRSLIDYKNKVNKK